MQDCGKQMGVLALNAAIEAGRMGEGGKQFVTAAETIRVSAGTYDELIDQAHKRLADSDEAAMQLALEFYGPMFLLYSVYDGAAQKETVTDLLRQHIDRFIARIEAEKA